MPRSKRWTYNSGLEVPLIVHVPEAYLEVASTEFESGGQSERLVGFVDLAPTVLSLAGIQPPPHMHGEAFLGEFAESPRLFNYGFRGRMDERYDMVRAVRDEQYIYMRNYNPHKIYGQYVAYMFQTPTTQVWHDLYEEGLLEPPMTYFWETKPPEELYDLENDPDETVNLAASPDYADVLASLREEEQLWTQGIRDLGFLPEHEIHARSVGISPHDMGKDDARFPAERIMNAARQATDFEQTDASVLLPLLEDSDSAVRYWGAMGFLIRGKGAVADHAANLRSLVDGDEASPVRIVAAEALGRYGTDEESAAALAVLIDYANAEEHGLYLAMQALNAIDYMDERASSVKDAIAELPDRDPNAHQRMGNYIMRLKEKIVADI